MITSAKAWFKKDDKHIIFTGNYMEVLIPDYYMTKQAASMVGEQFRTLGILAFTIYDSEEKKKEIKHGIFNLPVEIVTHPSSYRKEGDYTILEYKKMDIFSNAQIPCNMDTFSLCLNITISGKLPNNLPYNSILELWDYSFKMNGVSFDIPDMIKELIIAQIYRDAKNPMKTYGSVLGKNPKGDQYGYITMNPRELSSSKSTFNGIIFEDMDRMLISGIVGTKNKKEEVISPMEKVLKY